MFTVKVEKDRITSYNVCYTKLLRDVISNKAAFNVLIWFASLVAMAAGLKKVGVLAWIGTSAEVYLSGMSPTMLILSMLLFFFVLHYFFASTTAHTTALMPIFIAIAVKLMTPEQSYNFV